MTLKTILLGIGLSFIGIGAASAQDVLDAMPKRLAAEHVVREVSALTTANVLKPEPVAKKKSNPAGESIVRTARAIAAATAVLMLSTARVLQVTCIRKKTSASTAARVLSSRRERLS